MLCKRYSYDSVFIVLVKRENMVLSAVFHLEIDLWSFDEMVNSF